MTPSEWVTIISVIAAVAASLIGGTWILTWKLSGLKDDLEAKIAKVESDSSEKVGRVYQRLDQYKNFIESRLDANMNLLDSKYVCQKVCEILHTKTAEQVAEIKMSMALGFKELKEMIMELVKK